MHYFRKSCVFSLAIILAILPFFAFAADPVSNVDLLADDLSNVVTTKEYVDETTVTKHQGSKGQILQVNASGDLAITTPLSSINSTHTNTTSYKGVPTESAVVNYAIQKPSSASVGKVLTYGSGATADSRPEAQYIKVPVATGDPSASSNPATPSGFASIWLQ